MLYIYRERSTYICPLTMLKDMLFITYYICPLFGIEYKYPYSNRGGGLPHRLLGLNLNLPNDHGHFDEV